MTKMTMSELPYHLGIKMKLHPSFEQQDIINKYIGVSRFVYNRMVAINQRTYYWKKQFVPMSEGDLELREFVLKTLKKNGSSASNLRKSVDWMIDEKINTYVIGMSIKAYQAAWNNFRKVHNAGTPKFHKKTERGTFQFSNRYSGDSEKNMLNGNSRFIKKNKVNIPVLGKVKVTGLSDEIWDNREDIRIGTGTVSKDATGNYWLSFQIGSEIPFKKELAKTGSNIGIDLNTENFLTDSNGNIIDNPKFYRKNKDKLAKLQRIMSRRQLRAKKEGRKLNESKNYKKSKKDVAKLHQKIMNKRKDFLEKTSTTLIKNHDLVVAEKLQGKNMLKNHAMAMSISDVGWNTFTQYMTYKANLYGREFIQVSPRNTTQTCSDCGYIMTGDEKLTLKDREWTCPQCGVFHIRDHNAAKNILTKGTK